MKVHERISSSQELVGLTIRAVDDDSRYGRFTTTLHLSGEKFAVMGAVVPYEGEPLIPYSQIQHIEGVMP